MATPPVDNFLEQYLARHTGPEQVGFGLPIWLSWALALIVAGSTLLCLHTGQSIALLPTWIIALALAAAGVFAWQALAVSALASSLGYVLMYMLNPEQSALSPELLLAGGLASTVALLIGRAARLQARLKVKQQQADLLHQLCAIWAQSEGSCLKEVDLQGRLQAMNEQGMLVMEVCDFDALRGADWLGFWQDEWTLPARKAFEQALLGQFSRFSGFCPTAAGTPKWWDVLLLPVLDSRGGVESILSLSWDVTALRSSVEGLRLANAEYKNLLDVLEDGFFRLDRDWRFVQANARALTMLGEGDVVGQTLHQLLPEVSSGEFAEALGDAMEQGFARHFEWNSKRFDGWYRVSIYPRTDGVSVFFSDITGNVATIQHLQTTKARLRLTQAIGRFADWTYDLELQRFELSEQALQLLGLNSGETTQASLLPYLHPEDRLEFVTALLDVTEGGQSLDLKVRLGAVAAQARYFHFAGAVIKPHGHPAGLLVGSVHDITEQQARESALLEAEAFTRGIIDALPQAVAVLDDRGRVIAGNRAWSESTPAATGAPFGLEEGADYLAFCRAITGSGSETGQLLLEGIEALLEGIGGPLRLEYDLALDGSIHHFQAFATLMSTRQLQVVLVHEDITQAVQLKAALAEQTQRLKLVNEGSNDGIWEWKPAQNSLYVSDRFKELTGWSLALEDDFGEWLMAHVYPDDAETLATGWSVHLQQGAPFDVELRLQTPHGWRWFRIRAKAEWAGDVMLRVAGALMDINLQRDLLERIQASETRFRQMVEHLPHVFWEYDVATARLTYLSPALEKLLGMSPEMVYAEQDAWLRLVHPDDLELAERFKHRALVEHQATEVEFRATAPLGNGNEIWIRDRAFPFTDDSGQVVRMVGIAENITEARTFENRLFETAHFDRATGLPNRDMFLKRLTQQCLQATSEEPSFVVLSVGVDKIKWVQQVLGQPAKDELMRRLKVRIGEVLQGRGYLARLGSEHFGILLSRSDELTQASKTLEILMGSFSEPFQLNDETVKLNAFVGVARFPEHGDSAETVLKNALAASYAVAQSGQASHAFYDESLLAQDLNALRLEAGLERALERAELTLHYQPKFDLEEKRVCGAEALLRWNHSLLGLVSPLHFVPLLEDSGQIVPVGLWCIDQALAQLARWQAQGLDRFVMAVNVSVRQLEPELVRHVGQALALHNIQPECLELELTESIMHGDQAATEVVFQLKALGVRVAVDDFGTGYATLGSLRSFVPDVLKIDKTFLQHIVSEPTDQAIVRSVIDMGHALGMTVIAEGIECEAQRDMLAQLRCDQIQGYLIAPPVEAQEFTERFVR